MDAEMLAALRKPFEGKEIGKLSRVTCPKCSSKDRQCDEHEVKVCGQCKGRLGKHTHLDFVGHAHVTDRLNSVDPTWNWEPMAFTPAGLPSLDEVNGLWIRLTIGGVTRPGYGHAGQKRGGDAIKETIGDALRNGAMRFGVAIEQWMKEAPVSASVVAEDPVLPDAERANTLRNIILGQQRKKGHNVAWIDGEFHTWSRGEADFRTSQDPKQMADFQAYLKELS